MLGLVRFGISGKLDKANPKSSKQAIAQIYYAFGAGPDLMSNRPPSVHGGLLFM